ncbi:MAG: HAD family hydrolase [Dehalococcoidia bacterium]|nr:MAG: HAD family hydrolase [Dehalococcoidia bacterium]
MPDAPKAVFFDLDGTILDWETGMEDSWLASCERHCDGAHTPAQLHEAIRTRRTWFWSDGERAYRGRMDLDAASREIVRYAFSDLGRADTATADLLGDHYRGLRAAAIEPFPGAIETIEALHRRGVPLALITNGGARSQRSSIEKFGLERYFDCIVVEGEFGVGKPDERVFRHALAAAACDPAEAWMVGDNLIADIETPCRLGMHTVWVDAHARGLPKGATVQPHRIVRSIAELV